jgi:hypothetical protein
VILSAIRRSSNRLHYAWIIVAVAFAVAVMTAGVRSTPGVLIVPLEHEFGWSRATISFALGLNLLLFGAIGLCDGDDGPLWSTPHNHAGAGPHRRQRVVLTPAMSHPWQPSICRSTGCLYSLSCMASIGLPARRRQCASSGVVGPERIGIMVAWITVIHQVGSASAAYLAGVLRLAFDTYLEAFILSGILLIAAALMVLFVGGSGRVHQGQIAVTSLGSVL